MTENGNGLSAKYQFAFERELWMWRGLLVFLLLFNVVTNFVTFTIDRNQHAADNRDRASAWQELNDKADRNRAMILKNYDTIIQVERDLGHCASCHTHPKAVK